MTIDVRFRGLAPSPALREHAVRRLGDLLDREPHVVTAAFVRFVAAGRATRCQITVVMAQRSGTANVEDQHAEAAAALELAAARIARAVRTSPARPDARQPRRLLWTPA